MNVHKLSYSVFSAAGIIILILDGYTALAGASAGIDLCIKTVIPSLFPFLFLCSVLTSALWGESCALLKSVANTLGLPQGGESILIPAILGGYPAGAQAIADAYHEKRLSKSDAMHLLSFCNNAGPAFLFGMLVFQFPNATYVWALWIIQLLSVFITGLIYYRPASNLVNLPPRNYSVSKALTQTVKTVSFICGWVVLFQILTAFLTRWFLWYFPKPVQVIITGLLELSSGCCILTGIESVSLRFLVCSILLSFGGLCVAMQTSSVIGDIPLTPYLTGKLTQVLVTVPMTLLYLTAGWITPAMISSFILVFLILRKKDVDFCKHPMYNKTITIGRKHNHAVSQKN